MGCIIPCCSSIIDKGFTNEIQEAIGESIGSIPIAYSVERQRIIDEMRQASPHPYQGLLFDDYPTRNGTQVSALARRNVTSDQVKEQIANQVNTLLQPEIDSRLADVNPMCRAAASKTIEQAIQLAVNQAVDALVFNDDNTTMTATPIS